jgi:hypothetical protein
VQLYNAMAISLSANRGTGGDLKGEEEEVEVVV